MDLIVDANLRSGIADLHCLDCNYPPVRIDRL